MITKENMLSPANYTRMYKALQLRKNAKCLERGLEITLALKYHQILKIHMYRYLHDIFPYLKRLHTKRLIMIWIIRLNRLLFCCRMELQNNTDMPNEKYKPSWFGSNASCDEKR